MPEPPCSPWGWLVSARLGAWGPGRATGVPPGCPRTVRAAGWAPFAESPAPVAACLRAPGRGRLGGGRERNCTATQVESRAASRYREAGSPGIRGRIPSTSRPGEGYSPSGAHAPRCHRPVSACPGERGITRRPPAAQPGTWLPLSWPLGPGTFRSPAPRQRQAPTPPGSLGLPDAPASPDWRDGE